MRSILHIFIFVWCTGSIYGFNGPGDKHKKSANGWRLNFGTGLAFYNINDHHGFNPTQKMNATFGFRREVRVVRDYKTFMMFGIDYVFHGLRYDSYYFKPDSIKLYNKKFNYNYSLTVNELHFPIEMKYLLRRVDNSLFSPYLLVGYHLRYLLPGNLTVTKNGELVKQDHPDMRFRTYLFGNKVNASLCIAAGWQKNRINNSNGSFFAEINFQYGFSDYYFNSEYSASSMYINCIQVLLLVGAKF